MLREDQVQRYARHILLPDIGGVGQKRLLAAAVVVALGRDPAAESAALAYLAAAGVGRLLLAGDADAPVTTDEARAGILLGTDDIGRPRIQAMTERIAALNPDVRVERAPAELDSAELDSADPPSVPGAVPLAPAPALPPLGELAPAGPGAAPTLAASPSAVADALIRGGARAIRTLSRLARPAGATEPHESAQ